MPDSVMAIFSTTKAITGTALMQLVEEGKVSLGDAAKKYVPEIAELQVLDGFDAAGQPKTRAPSAKNQPPGDALGGRFVCRRSIWN